MVFLQKLLLMLLGVGIQMLQRLPGLKVLRPSGLFRECRIEQSSLHRAPMGAARYFAATMLTTALLGCSSIPVEIISEAAAPRAFESNHFLAAEKGSQHRVASHEGELTDETLSRVKLSSGQLVLTANFTPSNLFINLGIERYLPYSHIGILVIEDGVPFVYSMVSEEDIYKLGTLDGLIGSMTRSSLKDGIKYSEIVSIFDLPPEADPAKLVAYVKKLYEQRVPFDAFFDSDDHSRLYCPELVAVALEQAGARAPQPVPLNNNRSLAVVAYKWLKFKDTRILAPGLFAEPARHVVTLSAELSPMQIAAFFAVERELYQRFTSDQRIGALIELQENGRVKFRPAIRQFRSQVMLMARFAKTSDPEQIGEMVHRFANTYFADD